MKETHKRHCLHPIRSTATEVTIHGQRYEQLDYGCCKCEYKITKDVSLHSQSDLESIQAHRAAVVRANSLEVLLGENTERESGEYGKKEKQKGKRKRRSH